MEKTTNVILDNPQNLELSQCVKEINNIGNTIYNNICTGATNQVDWGSAQWIGFWIISSLLAVMILLLIGTIIAFVSDY